MTLTLRALVNMQRWFQAFYAVNTVDSLLTTYKMCRYVVWKREKSTGFKSKRNNENNPRPCMFSSTHTVQGEAAHTLG
jgi:hypothetical protein